VADQVHRSWLLQLLLGVRREEAIGRVLGRMAESNEIYRECYALGTRSHCIC